VFPLCAQAGVDSLGAVELKNQLQALDGVQDALPGTLVFQYPTARQLAEFLQPTAAAAVGAGAASSHGGGSARSRVSLTGMSAVLPASIASLSGARFSLACGTNAIGEVPLARWDLAALTHVAASIASRVRHGGFVCGAELTDNLAFGVSTSEAAAMDPQQRLLLERGYSALHGSGLDRALLLGSNTGIFLGIGATEFAQVLAASPAGSSVYAATGSAVPIASGRLSYVLGLNGSCLSCDTACSAALAMSHAGLRALQLDECPTGLVAGVNLILVPNLGVAFAVAGMTSARGRCHTFDGRADGYARAEGCGGMTLQQASFTAADGSCARREWCQLLGSAVRQDGRSASLTAPSGQAQQGLLGAALVDASKRPEELAVVEAHGTGTGLGDPIETGSLRAAVLALRQSASAALAIVGVKANIGHAEPAAGLTGLLKLVLALALGETPPNAQLRALNSHVSEALRRAHYALPVHHSPPLLTDALSGGVSSFGFSGTIAHCALQGTPANAALACAVSHSHRDMSRRRSFAWRGPLHPLLQCCIPHLELDSSIRFRTPKRGALGTLVVDHILHGRVVFPVRCSRIP
jgi:acyl transferase domain-containing protein